MIIMKTFWKTISYNFWATLTGFALVYLITGNIVVSGTASIAIRITNIPLYFIHEKLWVN